MPRKTDRRIERTRKLLRQSMLDLIMERGYDEISIQDVTDRANLGRATFYLHYREKDDLLADVILDQFDEYIAAAPPVTTLQSGALDQRSIQKIFDFAESRYDFYRIMMIGRGSMVGSRQLHNLLSHGFTRALGQLEAAVGHQPIIPQDFIVSYYAGSLLSMIYWWLENEMPYTSAEMAAWYQRVNGFATQTLFGPQGQTGLPFLSTVVEEPGKHKPARQKPAAKPGAKPAPPAKAPPPASKTKDS